MIAKNFKFWTRDNVQKTFNLTRTYQGFQPLTVWLKAEYPILEVTEILLKELSDELFLSIEEWNEKELKAWFISPLFKIVNFKINNFKAFLDRPLSIVINNEKVQGNVDLCVARGNQKPEQFYFFLHQDKVQKKGNNDPIGQLLIAMLATRKVNKEIYPLYGCYVSDVNWFFVLLDNNNYSVSNAYNATKIKDLKIILNALFYVKEQLKKVP